MYLVFLLGCTVPESTLPAGHNWPKSNQLKTSFSIAPSIRLMLQGDDDREVENSLVVKLDFDKFEVIKQLLRNRLKIVWCMRLERSENDDDRARIEVRPP